MFHAYYHIMPVSTGKARSRLRADTAPGLISMSHNSVLTNIAEDTALRHQQYSSNVLENVADLISHGIRIDDGLAKSQYYFERAHSVRSHREAAKHGKALNADIVTFAKRIQPYGPFLQNQRDIQATASRLGDMRLTNKRNYVPLKKDKRRRLFQKKVER